MKIKIKIPIKPRLGPQRTQTGAGVHQKDRGYQRHPKHRNKEQ